MNAPMLEILRRWTAQFGEEVFFGITHPRLKITGVARCNADSTSGQRTDQLSRYPTIEGDAVALLLYQVDVQSQRLLSGLATRSYSKRLPNEG
jgi:hypothetical protein